MTQSEPIKMVKLPIEVAVSEKYAQRYGGIKKLTALIEDILERYGNEEYFDPDIMEWSPDEFE